MKGRNDRHENSSNLASPYLTVIPVLQFKFTVTFKNTSNDIHLPAVISRGYHTLAMGQCDQLHIALQEAVSEQINVLLNTVIKGMR